ncbi:putative Late nodulin [Medicago truncatula]|uniref:Nodule Cysteine-Rich (NCR) secreted peptide n=1 Tax=Medicago truncatula TaxID=3880 RepID=A0A072VB20_MEDTR|nr:Nodule Cysteine-Rich (NCR) secreted peptide [Medicago truncatula]RHN75171.1 putative Late nodulin [Medicago truncatula]
MAQILMFIYVLIIFLSLFLVVTNARPCNNVDDCRKHMCTPYGQLVRCINSTCECVLD